MEESQVEIKQVSEREIWVGENRFYLDEDGIMYVEISGEHDKQIALEMKDAYLKLLSMSEGKVNIFADNSKSKRPSVEARKIFRVLTEHEKSGKIAVFGQNPVARVISTFIVGLSKNKDVHIFKSKDEALLWLKE
jgi:hypothetical protein